MNILKDKIALVTGGSRGIGRRTALLFAEEGATVIFTDLQENEASAELLAELRKYSPKNCSKYFRATIRTAPSTQPTQPAGKRPSNWPRPSLSVTAEWTP